MQLSAPSRDFISNAAIILAMAAFVVWGTKLVRRSTTTIKEAEVDEEWPDAM